MRSEADVVIVGAGAAGIASARRLATAKADFIVIEARSRVGGRAWTVFENGYPVDLGCGWLHSGDRNPWTKIAEADGFTVDRFAAPWTRAALENSFSKEEQAEFRTASESFYARLDDASEKESDRPQSDFLEPGNQWNARLDAISTYINGVELDHASLVEYARYEDSGVNWRVADGYAAAIARAAEGLPVMLDCPVRTIDHRGKRVTIETARGAISACAVIITISTALVANESIRFTPALPKKTEAAGNLPMGLADKLFLSLAIPNEFPKDARLFGKVYPSGAATYHLNPFGRPLIEAYFGGKLARELEAGGEQAFADFAINDLVSLLGSEMRGKIKPLKSSAWERDEFARGAYSYAKVGHADDRMALAESVDDRIFFAGEACSRGSFSTAQGAYEAGVLAAEAVLKTLA